MAAVGDNAVSSADASRLLDAFEEALEDLRVTYEKYFVGIERQAPAQRHKEIKAQMRRLEELRVRSTVVRFRLGGLRARLVTYEHYWTRVLGQIEKGTYRRDLQRRTQRRGQTDAPDRGTAAAGAEAASGPGDGPEAPANAADVPRPRRVTELSALQPSAPVSGPPPPPIPVPGMKAVEIRLLFQDLVRAKQAAGEDVQGLTERALARKLAREVPKLREQHGGPVRFEVATVAGKVRLRARPVADGE